MFLAKTVWAPRDAECLKNILVCIYAPFIQPHVSKKSSRKLADNRAFSTIFRVRLRAVFRDFSSNAPDVSPSITRTARTVAEWRFREYELPS